MQTEFMIWWNKNFPLDRAYRKKYSIGPFSSQHKELSPIFIFYEFREYYLTLKQELELKKKLRREKLLSEGYLIDPNYKGIIEQELESINNEDLTKLFKDAIK